MIENNPVLQAFMNKEKAENMSPLKLNFDDEAED